MYKIRANTVLEKGIPIRTPGQYILGATKLPTNPLTVDRTDKTVDSTTINVDKTRI